MTRRAEESFLHRQHVVKAFWVLVTAAVTVPATVWLTKTADRDAPPQRVFVVNQDTIRRFIVQDTTALRQIAELRGEVIAMTASGKGRPIEAQGSAGESQAVRGHAFDLPPNVKGDVGADLNSLLASGCPAKVEHPSAIVTVSTSRRKETVLADYSPLIIRLLQRRSSDAVTQLSEQRVPLDSTNLVDVALPSQVGAYKLEFGLYKLNELSKPFPTFFRRECEIVVS